MPILKEMRRFMDENYPGRILLCEANQWPEDVRPYFGDGDEFHMGFHFPIMPRIYMALRRGDRRPARMDHGAHAAHPGELPVVHLPAQPRRADPRNGHRLTSASGCGSEYAPEPRMRLNLGIRRRLAPLLDNDRRKIELANSLLFTLPGSPDHLLRR